MSVRRKKFAFDNTAQTYKTIGGLMLIKRNHMVVNDLRIFHSENDTSSYFRAPTDSGIELELKLFTA